MMQFGAHLPSYWDDYGSSNVRIAVEEAAKAAETLGYDSVWANDMVINTSASLAKIGATGQIIEPLITLASLVHLVPRLKLGTSVLVLPQRNAMLVAKQVSALDLLSEGRFILGVGVGWRAEEFKLLGADFAHRAAITDEAIEVMQTLWREPVASFHGQFHRFDDAVMLPKPAHRNGPPIWVGGNTDASIRRAAIHRAAKYGRAWIPYIQDLESFQSGVALLRDLTKGQQGPMVGGYFNLRIEKPGQRVTVQTQSRWAAISIGGSPDTIAQTIEQFRQSGLEYAICLFESENVDDYLRQMRVFAEQIAPHFAEAV
jgi:probable F420-dependent oxidoreductase